MDMSLIRNSIDLKRGLGESIFKEVGIYDDGEKSWEIESDDWRKSA